MRTMRQATTEYFLLVAFLITACLFKSVGFVFEEMKLLGPWYWGPHLAISVLLSFAFLFGLVRLDAISDRLARRIFCTVAAWVVSNYVAMQIWPLLF